MPVRERNYNGWKKKELIAEIEERIENGENIKIPKNPTEDALMSVLRRSDKKNAAMAYEAIVSGKTRHITVSLHDVVTNPLNTKPEEDYDDPEFEAKLQQSGILKDAVVMRASQLDPAQPDNIYYPIAGNRTVYNLKRLLEEGVLDSENITVKLKVYDTAATYEEVKSQVILDLKNDNESALKPSLMQKLTQIKNLRKAGHSMAFIARQFGVSIAYISQINSLDILPMRIKKLIHAAARKDFFGAKEKEELIEKNIEFRELDDGSIEILSIGWSTAKELAKLFPKPPPKYNFDSVDDWQEEFDFWRDSTVVAMQEYLSQEHIIAIITQDTKKCVKDVAELMVNDGLIDEPVKKTKKETVEPAPAQPVQQELDDDVLGFLDKMDDYEDEDDVQEQEVTPAPSTSVKIDLIGEEEAAKRGMLKAMFVKDRGEFISQFGSGIDLAPDWHKKITDLLNGGETAMENVMMILISAGVVTRYE